MDLAAFFAAVDKLPDTLRYQRLDRLDAYYHGTQYRQRQLDVNGYRKAMPGVYGSGARIPSWKERDPGRVWNLRKEVVQEITNWTLSGGAWCRLEISNDAEAEDWLNAVTDAAGMPAVMVEARNYAGGQGTAVVSFRWSKGELLIEAHNPKNCWVLDWVDQERHRPRSLVLLFVGDDPLATDPNTLPLMARVWDESRESYFVRVKDPAGVWRWDEIPDRAVTHGLGFCPVYWYPQNARDGQHDGHPDAPETEDLIDDANELCAAATVTTKRNADDTLVVKEDPALNAGQIRKGGYNTIFARGGAEYLSQKGESAEICWQLAEKSAQQVYSAASVVKASIEDLGKATTGEALKRLYQPMLTEAGRHRTMIAKGLIVPLCIGILRSARALLAKRQTILVPPRVEVADDGTQTIVQRTPGTSEFVQCAWPEAFPPTAQDKLQAVQTAVAATVGKQVLSLDTAISSLAGAGFPIANVEDEKRKIAEDQQAAAEHQAASLGLAAEATAAAGPVDDSAPAAAE